MTEDVQYLSAHNKELGGITTDIRIFKTNSLQVEKSPYCLRQLPKERHYFSHLNATSERKEKVHVVAIRNFAKGRRPTTGLRKRIAAMLGK